MSEWRRVGVRMRVDCGGRRGEGGRHARKSLFKKRGDFIEQMFFLNCMVCCVYLH